MRRYAFPLAALIVIGAPAGCLKIPPELPEEPDATPGAPSTAADVLDRYVEGSGGEATLRGIAARSIEARMIVRGQAECAPEDEACSTDDQVGSFLLKTTSDGKLYRRTVLNDLVEEKGFDGKVGWQLAGELLRLEDRNELELSREDAILHWYFDLEERGVQVTLARPRKEDSDGNVATLDGIHWEGGTVATSPKTMWFDRSTGLLREEIVEESIEDIVQRQTIIYDDYREIDGVQVPFTIRVVNVLGEQEQVVEFVTQRIDHEAVEATQFAMPVLPPPKPVPDQRLAALRQAEQGAKEKPKDLGAQVALVRASWVAGHFDTTVSAAKAALAIDAKEPEVLLLLARAHVLRGETKEASAVLRKLESLEIVKPEIIALEEAWIHYRRRDYSKLAKALDAVGNPVFAGRFRSFVGKPLQSKVAKNACVTTLPLVATSPLAVVEIEVEGSPVQAIIDSGASDLILSQSFTAAQAISTRPLSAGAPQGTPTVGYAQAESMTLDNLTISNVPIDVFNDLAMSEMAGQDLDEVQAVLGLSMLSDFQITLDIPGKSLELVGKGNRCKSERAARRSGDGMPFWQHETHYIYVQGAMNGAEGLYLLNTGMRGADITANLLAYGHAGVGIPPMKDGAAMGTIGSFALGGVEQKGLASAVAFVDPNGQVRGFFERMETSGGFREDGMLGLAVLGEQRITIDFEDRRIYLAKSEPAS